MTINEFKAWLEGFEESVNGSPTKAQWLKVKQRLETVYGDAVQSIPYAPQPWYPDWYTPYPYRWYSSTSGSSIEPSNPNTTAISLSGHHATTNATYLTVAKVIGQAEGALA